MSVTPNYLAPSNPRPLVTFFHFLYKALTLGTWLITLLQVFPKTDTPLCRFVWGEREAHPQPRSHLGQ